jgi:hypothetical protein
MKVWIRTPTDEFTISSGVRVGEVYCLFSAQDGVPRDVAQMEETAQKRRRHHIGRALDGEKDALYDWIRSGEFRNDASPMSKPRGGSQISRN